MKLTTVYSSRNSAQLQLIVTVLQSRGVPAIVTDQETMTMLGWPVKVRVRDDHAIEARTVIEEFLRAGEVQTNAQPWVCPGCGEKIEAQFTDCWNCQAPRPAEGDATLPPSPPPRAQTPADPQIVIDLPCVGCRYNLRTLAIDGKCPECGHPVFPSLLALLRVVDVPEEGETSPAFVLRPCLAWLEARYGFTVEAIRFVESAWPAALARNTGRDALSLAKALYVLAPDYFGGPLVAARALESWDLATPDSLARLIDWLIELRVVVMP